MKGRISMLTLLTIILATLLITQPVSAEPQLTMTDLGTLGGSTSYAMAINERGQVVGFSYTDFAHYHAFLWTTEDGMIDLGDLGGGRSYAFDINERGQVVGQSLTALGEWHAFLWTAQTGMIELGEPRSFMISTGGPADIINERGQVVGTSITDSGELHAVLWTP